MGSGGRLSVTRDASGDMLLVAESGDFRQRVVVEVTRSPLRKPRVHAALCGLAAAIEAEGGGNG